MNVEAGTQEVLSVTSASSFLDELPSLWQHPVDYACAVELLGKDTGLQVQPQLAKDVVLVVDVSGSMDHVIPIVRQTCHAVASSLNPAVHLILSTLLTISGQAGHCHF